LRKRAGGFRAGWGHIRGSLVVASWTFLIALGVTLFSTAVLTLLNPWIAAFVLVLIVAVGVVFDVIGLAAAAAVEAPFHAMAAKKGFAAGQAIAIVRNAEFVSSFCNDLVGDVCGTVSGAAALAIVFRLAILRPGLDPEWLSVLTVSAVAALTVGGKAAGKGYALDRANEIVFRVAEVLASLQRATRGLRRLLPRRAETPDRGRRRGQLAKEERPSGSRPRR
jgi:hypothetical protein